MSSFRYKHGFVLYVYLHMYATQGGIKHYANEPAA